MDAEYLADIGLQEFVWMIIGFGVAFVSGAFGGLVSMYFIRKRQKRNYY